MVMYSFYFSFCYNLLTIQSIGDGADITIMNTQRKTLPKQKPELKKSLMHGLWRSFKDWPWRFIMAYQQRLTGQADRWAAEVQASHH